MSTEQSPASITYGCSLPFSNIDEAKKIYDVVARYPEVKELDTARVYKRSEKWIGELGLAKKYRITTKAPTFSGRVASWLEQESSYSESGVGYRRGREMILESARESLKLLGVDKVDVYLLHWPDTETPFGEQLDAIQKLYLEGRFEKFGVSNFTASQVQEIHRIAVEKNCVLPTVYQGSYNLLLRNIEPDLFPTLRSLGMSFQAHSPLAGGFLVKTPEYIANPPDDSRWDVKNWVGDLYQQKYHNPQFIEYLRRFIELSKENGIGQAEIALRWIRFHSILDGRKGDTVIVGSGRPEQLEETLRAVMEKGPLEDELVHRLNELWEEMKEEGGTALRHESIM